MIPELPGSSREEAGVTNSTCMGCGRDVSEHDRLARCPGWLCEGDANHPRQGWVDLFGAAPDLPAEQFGIDPDPDPLRAVIREALTHLECGRALLAEDLLRGSLPGGDTNEEGK